MRQLIISESITERSTPSVEKYLRDISRYELITAEEEVRLAKLIKKGDQEALEKLVRANLRFVVSVAKKYGNMGLSFSDLINEGNIGLVKAAERFDETRGFKFISYAVWWIRQCMIQALSENSRMVRLPLNKMDSVRKVRQAVSQLEQEYEREPTAEEVARVLDLNLEQVNDTLGISLSHISIDAPVAADAERTFLDLLQNQNAEEEADRNVVYRESLRKDIDEALSSLPDQQKEVIRLSFGLGETDPMGLEDVGVKLNISRERVRQIKTKALRHLQTSSDFLKTYLGN